MTNIKTPPPKRIGDLNGWWAFLIKVFLATYVPVISGAMAWAIWVTSSIYTLQSNEPEFSVKDATIMHSIILDEIADRYSSKDLIQKVDVVDRQQREILLRLERIQLQLEDRP